MKALIATHNGNGYTGHMTDEEMYNKVRDGELDWKPHIKPQITHYRVPAVVFEKLLELDRAQQNSDSSLDECDGRYLNCNDFNTSDCPDRR